MAYLIYPTLALILCYALMKSPVTALRPSMTLSSNDNLDDINVGDTISINCTVVVPEGYRIGYMNFPLLSKVSWAQSLIKDITVNTTIPLADEYPRLSVTYFNSSSSNGISNIIEHTYQLIFSNVHQNDSGFYFCTAPVSFVTGFPSLFLRDYVYVSVGELLAKDVPRCSVDPDEIVIEEMSITPICFLQRDDATPKIVQWTLIYPDGRTEQRSGYSLTKLRGLNFERYTFTLSNIDVSLDGLVAVCNVAFPDDGYMVQRCTTAVSVIPGPEIVGTNLLGASVGDTMTISVRLHLPPQSGYSVSGTSWSKIIDSDYGLIINDETIHQDRIDPNRYDVQTVNSNGMFSNTVTITDVQDGDAGFYHSLLSVSSTKTRYSYLKYLRITVGSDLSEELIPLCEVSQENPHSDNVFSALCTVKRTTNRPSLDLTWTSLTPSGEILNPTSYRQDFENYISLNTQYAPFSLYNESILLCTVSSPDLPGLEHNCTLGPFMESTTVDVPTTIVVHNG